MVLAKETNDGSPGTDVQGRRHERTSPAVYGESMTLSALRRTRQIAADPATVWAVITDIDHSAEFLSRVTTVTRRTDGPYGVGTRWQQTRSVLGRPETAKRTVTVSEPPERTVITTAAQGVQITDEFTLTPSGSCTELSFECSAPKGAPGGSAVFAPRLLARIGARVSSGELDQDLRDITAEAERRAAAFGRRRPDGAV